MTPYQPLLTVMTSESDLDIGAGRNFFFGCTNQQLYALLWDPAILAHCVRPPRVRTAGEPIASPADALLLFAQPTLDEDAPAIRAVLDAGGSVILNHPTPALLESLTGVRVERTAAALRERWTLLPGCRREYYYPDRRPYHHVAEGGRVLSRIGDRPDLVLHGRVGAFMGDPFDVMYSYIHAPFYSDLLLDLADLLGEALGVRGGKLDDSLRRDFHSFGYAYQTTRELARCDGADLCLAEPAAIAIDAARTASSAQLAEAFDHLDRAYRQLGYSPAIFTDTLHGGGMYEELGYFEFDWPQHAADMLRRHLRLAAEGDYHFNIDFGAASVEHLAKRYPRLIQELREAIDAGRVEFTNGSYTQPYPPLHTLATQLYQYDEGLAALQRVLGTRPRHLVSQEFAFSTQTPAMMNGYDYRGVCLRVQHFGDAPRMDVPVFRWASPDDTAVTTIPSRPDRSESRNDLSYANVHIKLYHARKVGHRPPVFTCMGDVTYYRPMREELARACRFMPALGSFCTWRECFERVGRPDPGDVRHLTIEDFQTHGVAILDAGYSSSNMSGYFISAGLRSMRASHLMTAAETLEALTRAPPDRSWCWKPLLSHQSHDSYIVAQYPSGGFMGGVTDPASVKAGRATPTVADYLGSWDHRPVAQFTGEKLACSERGARASIRRRLAQAGTGDVAYNAGPARRRVVRRPGKFASDALALVDLPAWSVVPVEPRQPDHPVRAEGCTLDNGLIRVTFDPRTATIEACTVGGRDLVLRGSHRFALPGAGEPRCIGANIVTASPLRGQIDLRTRLRTADRTVAELRTRVTLDADSSFVHFVTHIISCEPLTGDSWERNLAVCFTRPDDGTWLRSHFNLLEPSTHDRLFSPYLLVHRGDATDACFINHGNELYVRRGGEIRHLLRVRDECAARLAYAVGPAGDTPIIQSRAQTQPIYVQTARRAARTGPLTVGRLAPEAIEMVSYTLDDAGGARLRLANTLDREVEALFEPPVPIARAQRTDFLGGSPRALTIADGRIKLPLKPYEIVQVQLYFQ